MDGLIIRLLHAKTGRPESSFWEVFGPIRQDLDRLYWCLTDQPWFSAPEDFDESICVDYSKRSHSGIMLWGPGDLSRYADAFSEEEITLWAIEPTMDNPIAGGRDNLLSRSRSDKSLQGEPGGRTGAVFPTSSCGCAAGTTCCPGHPAPRRWRGAP